MPRSYYAATPLATTVPSYAYAPLGGPGILYPGEVPGTPAPFKFPCPPGFKPVVVRNAWYNPPVPGGPPVPGMLSIRCVDVSSTQLGGYVGTMFPTTFPNGPVRAPQAFASPYTFTVTLYDGSSILATKEFSSAAAAHAQAHAHLIQPPPSASAQLSAFMTQKAGGQYLEMTTLGYWKVARAYMGPGFMWKGLGPKTMYPWSS